jgi:hypothetical protein
MVLRSDILCASYEGRCTSCGHRVDYLFALDDEIVPADRFGGARPSTIIDAGQYMAAAVTAAKQVSIHAGRQPEQRRLAVMRMARAVACLEEVLKWIPVGDDRIPQDAFFTPEGAHIYAREPGRFRRARLEQVLAAYRETLLRLSSGV